MMSQNKRQGILLCMVGPVASGKTSLSAEVQKYFINDGTPLSVSISITSRAPRPGEVSGNDYEFISREGFVKMAEAGEFFEYEEVHGNLYGTKKETLDAAIREGRDLILRIDINGSLRVKRTYPRETVIIFITPSSFDELTKRVMKRAGGMSQAEIDVRLQTARKEYKTLEENRTLVDYQVINDDFSSASEAIVNIIKNERLKRIKG